MADRQSRSVRGIDSLLQIMARLRDPTGGCAWDLEQTFETIAPYTIEEAYEVEDAIRSGDRTALRDELGDLLLQVVFHSQMACEVGDFGFDDVVEAICDKLVRRHPNVFGNARVESAAAQTRAWEDHKARERSEAAIRNGQRASILDGVAQGLPALMRARKLLSRARRSGFAWPDPAAALSKLDEELDELRAEMGSNDSEHQREELGDLLIAACALAGQLDLDPEQALRQANAKFERRLRHVEDELRERGLEMSQLELPELLEAWERAKRQDSGPC